MKFKKLTFSILPLAGIFILMSSFTSLNENMLTENITYSGEELFNRYILSSEIVEDEIMRTLIIEKIRTEDALFFQNFKTSLESNNSALILEAIEQADIKANVTQLTLDLSARKMYGSVYRYSQIWRGWIWDEEKEKLLPESFYNNRELVQQIIVDMSK